MQSFRGSIQLVRRHSGGSGFSSIKQFSSSVGNPFETLKGLLGGSLSRMVNQSPMQFHTSTRFKTESIISTPFRSPKEQLLSRYFSTNASSFSSASQDSPLPNSDLAPRIKFKRLDKTAKHIMQILDKEAVEEVKSQREIPDIQPGYIVQLKVEVPENKRRISTLKGIVIARRNAGLSTTFRLRRLVAGVGVESLFPLYSPNIKEIKVLDKKKVRRAKLYYLRDKMNALKKQ